MNIPSDFYYKRNRLQQLKGFYYTAQTGSVSRAAKIMGLSQSTVSLQIQSLEKDINTELFFRDKKKIKLTKKGKDFYNQSSFFIHGIDSLFEKFVNKKDEKEDPVIDIAANHVSISYILPKYLKIFKDQNPNINFKIRNLDKATAINRLINNEVDIFFYPMMNDEIPDELEFIPIVKYQPILLIRRDHPLASKKNVTLKDVSEYELVRIDSKYITLPSFEELIRNHNIKSKIEFEFSDWEILKKFVQNNVGIAIISNVVLEGESGGDLIGKDLTDYFPEMTYGFLVKKGRILAKPVINFIELIRTKKVLLAQ